MHAGQEEMKTDIIVIQDGIKNISAIEDETEDTISAVKNDMMTEISAFLFIPYPTSDTNL